MGLFGDFAATLTAKITIKAVKANMKTASLQRLNENFANLSQVSASTESFQTKMILDDTLAEIAREIYRRKTGS
jgi:hypothetical protein